MLELEGVIKYQLRHDDGELPATLDTTRLNGWRSLLYRLQLIGQQSDRYGGLGYGNISQRLTPGLPGFVITGTQSGHLAYLGRQHFAVVTAADPLRNQLQSKGPTQPSSEALTHASVYQQQADAHAVIHVHSPALWRNAEQLGLPTTRADIAYGTVAMALAVEQLLQSGQLDAIRVFAMLGHEDGIVSFGGDLDQAASALLMQLARAITIEQSASAF